MEGGFEVLRSFLKDSLTIIGLGLNLIGAYRLYRSILSYPDYYQKPGQKESYPMAVLNMPLAKRGIGFVICGMALQLLAVCLIYN